MRKEIVLLLAIFLVPLISADDCRPSMPVSFTGNIFYNETLLEGTFPMRTMMNGDTVGVSEVEEGWYYIDVSPCEGTTSGEISFLINGIEALETFEYDTSWQTHEIELDLTITTLPPTEDQCGNGVIGNGEQCDDGNQNNYDGCSDICLEENGWTCTGQPSVCELDPEPELYCGDSICNNGESCLSCSADCGVCDDGGDDNGGGGNNNNNGGNGGTSRNTHYSTPENNLNEINQDNNQGLPFLNKPLDISDEEDPRRTITGAVIGALGNAGTFVAITFILIIAVASIAVRSHIKKIKANNFKK